MITFYAMSGQNGLGITKSWKKVQQLQKYFGNYFNVKKFPELSAAVAHARYQYNSLNTCRNLYYHGMLHDEQVLFTKDVMNYIEKDLLPVPTPLVFFDVHSYLP